MSVVVALETSMGSIDIEVDLCRAPISARAFLRYVEDGSFARSGAFFRVVRGAENDHARPTIDVVQAALLDASAQLVGIEHESTLLTGLKHLDGTVSLARGALGTATGASFFICIGDQPALDADGGRSADREGFAAFGRVMQGMDMVRAIHMLPTSGSAGHVPMRGQMLDPPVRIIGAEVGRAGVAARA